MSTQTANIINYTNPAQEPSKNRQKTGADRSDNVFSQTLEKIQSRFDKNKVEEKNSKNEQQPKANDKKEGQKPSNEPVDTDAKSEAKNETASQNIPNQTQETENSASPSIIVETGEAETPVLQSNVLNAKETQDILKNSSQNAILKNVVKAEENSSVKMTAQAIASEVETEGNVLIKASEKAIASAKESTITQNHDISSKAKAHAISNLAGIENTDTTVVESQTKKDTGSNTFSQGNASEQIIKLSIENAKTADQPKDVNFTASLDRHLQTNQIQQPKEINKPDVLNQINQKLEELPQTQNSKVTIILKPENLGRIHLEIVSTSEGITAKMLTDNQQVKELLDKNMEVLKSQLSAQGVNVNNIRVENTHQTSNNAMNFDSREFGRDFSNGGGHTHSNNTSAGEKYSEDFDFEDAAAENTNIQPQIIHEGKIDYKV